MRSLGVDTRLLDHEPQREAVASHRVRGVCIVTEPVVSVVIPAFNREHVIEAAVTSVLEQRYNEPIEVIIVDDGSIDGTVARVERIGDPRVKLVRHSDNAGVSAARNTGIEAARGAWVAFQDSDDTWLPDKLALQMALTSDPDVVAVYCGMTVDLGPGRPARYLPNPSITPRAGHIQQRLLRDSFISTQTLVARRSLLTELNGFDPSLPALVDWDLVIRLSGRGRVALVDEPLVTQQFSANSITHSTEKRLFAQLAILEKYPDLFASHPRVAAYHCRRIAGGARRLGQWKLAARYGWKSCKLQPFAVRYWLHAVYLQLGSMARSGARANP